MVSVIIPACNEERYIERTLQQIPKTVEIIVVCNGCTDKTATIARKYARTYVLEEGNVSKARNYGAQRAHSNVLVFLDADTVLDAPVLHELESITDNPFFGTCRVRPDSKRVIAKFYLALKNLLGYFGFHNASGIIFCTKDVFKNVQFDERLRKYENHDFVQRMKPFGKRYYLRSAVTTSMRRYEKFGYLHVPLYWIKQIFTSDKDYPVVR